MATLDSNKITGVSSFFGVDSAASKQYVEGASDRTIPSTTGNDGKFLTTTDGTTLSWDYPKGSQEFSSPGTYTYSIPTNANNIYVEVIGGGGGASMYKEGGGSLINKYLLSNDDLQGSTSLNVYVGSGGTHLSYSDTDSGYRTSTDGIVWSIRTSPLRPGSNKINYAFYNSVTGNYYMDGGPFFTENLRYIKNHCVNDISVYSTDAISWSELTSIPPFFRQLDIHNGLYFASPGLASLSQSSYGGTDYFNGLAVSTDSVVWTLRTIGYTLMNNYSVGYGNVSSTDIYHLFSQNGFFDFRIYASTDTIHWQLRTHRARSTNFELYSPVTQIFQDGNFVVCNTGGLQVSTDSVVWQLRSTVKYDTSSQRPTSLTYGDGLYVLGAKYVTNGQTYSGGPPIQVSTDTIVWTLRTTPRPTDTQVMWNSSDFEQYPEGYTGADSMQVNISDITYASDKTEKFVAVSSVKDPQVDVLQNQSIITSTDTIVWTLRTTGNTTTFETKIAYGNGIFMMHGDSRVSIASSGEKSYVSWTDSNQNTYSVSSPGGFAARDNNYNTGPQYNLPTPELELLQYPSKSSPVGSGSSGSLFTGVSGTNNISTFYNVDITINGGLSTSVNGSNIFNDYGISFPSGGSGGYAGTSTDPSGNGGNGFRGGGGGGGGISYKNDVTLGGFGGDGYVKIIWR